MNLYWSFDAWLIEFFNDVGRKLQTTDKVHYVDLVCRAGLFLLTVSSLGAVAEHSPGTAQFWVAVLPYFVAWLFIINMVVSLYNDRKHWDYTAIGKNMDRVLRLRQSLRWLRLLEWVFLVGFGLVPILLTALGLHGDAANRWHSIWSTAASALVTNGTALLFLYVFSILPTADFDKTEG